MKLTGTVRKRPEGQENKKSRRVRSEWSSLMLEVLSKSEVPPFEITEYTGAAEDIRLKYRYLDLRRKSVFDKIAFRAEMNKFTVTGSRIMDFSKCRLRFSPYHLQKGARDYLIPSLTPSREVLRLPRHRSSIRQLLMVGGWINTSRLLHVSETRILEPIVTRVSSTRSTVRWALVEQMMCSVLLSLSRKDLVALSQRKKS